jgi:hypothetical protein
MLKNFCRLRAREGLWVPMDLLGRTRSIVPQWVTLLLVVETCEDGRGAPRIGPRRTRKEHSHYEFSLFSHQLKCWVAKGLHLEASGKGQILRVGWVLFF